MFTFEQYFLIEVIFRVEFLMIFKPSTLRLNQWQRFIQNEHWVQKPPSPNFNHFFLVLASTTINCPFGSLISRSLDQLTFTQIFSPCSIKALFILANVFFVLSLLQRFEEYLFSDFKSLVNSYLWRVQELACCSMIKWLLI